MNIPYLCLLVSLFLTSVTADYECLCNYEIQNNVLSEPRPGANDIGKLYEFDCKPTYQLVAATAKWQAIQFENQVGYVPVTDKTKVQTCPGLPNLNDIVTTTTTTVQTKPLSTRSVMSYTTRRASSTVNSGSAATALSTNSPSPSSSMSTMASTRYFSSLATTSKTLRYSTTSSTRKQTTSTVRTTAKQLHCPPQVRMHGTRDYLEVNGRCYEFNMDPHKNWPDAEHDCNTRGGHLVSIGSMAEQNTIYNALRRKHFYHGDNDIWIGLTDKDIEGHWKWSSGERASFLHWAPGDGHGNFEDCAMIEMDKGGQWGDISCEGFLFSHERHGYVCEYNSV